MPHNIVTVAGCPPDHPARLWYSAARALREAGLLLRKPPAGRLSVCEFNSDPVGGITASWEASVQLTGAPRHWMLANLTACAEGGSYDQPLSPSSYVNIKTAHTGEVRVREALRPALRRGKRRTAKRLTWCQRKTHFKNGSRLFLFAPERCDLLVVTVANHSSRRGGGGGQYTGVPGAVRTRAMFHELPTALRVAMETAAKPSARRFTQALLVTGYPCGQPKAKYKTISSAWVREGPCWVERWQELVAAGAVRALPERWARRGCSASAAVPWCAGVVVSPAASMCSSRPPLLPEPPPSRFNRTRAKRRCRGSWCEDIANASMPSGSASGRDPRAVPGSTGGGRAATAPGGIRVDEVVFGDARVAALARHTLRYYMVVPCGAAPLPIGAACEHGAAADARACATCLLFKDGPSEKWVAGLRSTDGLQFDGEPVVAFTSASLWEGREAYRRAVRTAADAQANHDHDQILTHNLALLPLNGSYIAIGGTHRNFLGARSRSAPASDGHERDHPRHGGVFIGKSPGWTLALPGSGGTAPHGASTVDDVAAEAAAVATVAMAGGAAAAAMEMSRRADDAFAGARRQHARVQALRAAGKSTGISPADSISALRLAEAEAARAAHAAAVAIAAEPPGVLVRGGQVGLFSSARPRNNRGRNNASLPSRDERGLAIEIMLPAAQERATHPAARRSSYSDEGCHALCLLVSAQARPWHPQLAVDGALRGCIERRDSERLPYLLPNGTCEFDGRLSLARSLGSHTEARGCSLMWGV